MGLFYFEITTFDPPCTTNVYCEHLNMSLSRIFFGCGKNLPFGTRFYIYSKFPRTTWTAIVEQLV